MKLLIVILTFTINALAFANISCRSGNTISNVTVENDTVAISWSNGESAFYRVERQYVLGFNDSIKRYEAVYLSGNVPGVDLQKFDKLTFEHPSKRYFGIEGSLAFRISYFGEIANYYLLYCE